MTTTAPAPSVTKSMSAQAAPPGDSDLESWDGGPGAPASRDSSGAAWDPLGHYPDGLYGPRGWSVAAGVWDVLATARDDLRSRVIPAQFGVSPRGLIEEGVPTEDFVPFHDLGPKAAARLLEILPSQCLADVQNLGPSLGVLLTACVEARGSVRLSGYGIGPQRSDERITVDGLWSGDERFAGYTLRETHTASCQCRHVWDAAREAYGLDASGRPDEISYLPRHWDHGETGLWLWWD